MSYYIPTLPTSITVPNPFMTNVDQTISWSASTVDPPVEITYHVHRSTDNGATWGTLYIGRETSTTDLISNFSHTTIKYKVGASTSYGGFNGEYFESATVPVEMSNTAPTAPTSTNIYSAPFPPGKEITFTWSGAKDAEYNLEGYIVEMRTDISTSWVEKYRGSNTQFNTTVPTSGSYFSFRLRSYDSLGAESSEYITSDYEITHNTPPVIIGLTDGAYLGEFSENPRDFVYSFTDAEWDAVTVTEKVNDVTTLSGSYFIDAEHYFWIPSDIWSALGNGLHTLTLIVTDREGLSTTCTMTFTKIETEIEVMYKTAISADSMPTKGIYTVEKVTPSNAIFSFHVCNNGFDSVPTWEDVTEKVLTGERFSFTNKSKTASKWGVNILVKVDRNNTVGDCYISRVQGYFK